MKISVEKIICREFSSYKTSKRDKPFLIVKYQFFYESESFDNTILRKIEEAGIILANSVNEKAANNSTQKRPPKRILSNAIAGILAEYCWKNFLNSASLNLLVKETEFEDAAYQIDLATINTSKTIEVRSSFPRNGIEFAICHPKFEFDILGPYKNDYKPNEPKKDFYLRTLFKVPSPISFLEEYKKDGFITYLTGGATWAMMSNDEIAIEKNLVPEDDLNGTEEESTFRVIPFSKAMDCKEIFQEIKKA